MAGNLDDYSKFQGSITANAKSYRTAALAEGRLLAVEEELAELRGRFVDVDAVLKRSQFYTSLLLIIQGQLFNLLPGPIRRTLQNAGLANLPQTFVIWRNAWNALDPNTFPLPASMATYTLAPALLAFHHLLFDNDRESKIGIVVRQAWEALEVDMISRDLMVHCWCSKKGNASIRNPIAHPDTTKEGAEEIITHDLCDDLQYLNSRAMKYISDSPDIFKTI